MATSKALALVLVVVCACPVSAQRGLTEGERDGANLASWATAAASVAFDVAAAFKCEQRARCLAEVGVRQGAAFGLSQAIKAAFPRPRPCAADGLCGRDGPTANDPSEHTFHVFAAIDTGSCGQGARFAIQAPLAIGTAVGRWASLRHDWRAITMGAAAGLLVSRVTRCWGH